MLNSPDARDLAFDALLPIAQPTERALDRVRKLVDRERKVTTQFRASLHTTQRAALLGLARFAHAVAVLGVEYGGLTDVQRASSPVQEAQNIYLWIVAGRYMLRVKHEPVDRVDPGTARLFSQLPPDARPVTVFLTWDVAADGNLRNPVFATLEEPAWTIPLAQLLAHDAGDVATLPAPSPGLVVRSTRPKADEQRDRE